MKNSFNRIFVLSVIACVFIFMLAVAVGAAEYSYSAAKGDNSMEWAFDETTGAVSVRPLSSATVATKTCFEASEWTSFASANSANIKTIHIEYVEGGYNFTGLRGPIRQLKNLVSVTWDAELFVGGSIYGDADRGSGYPYQGNTSLTTFGPKGTASGTLDLSCFSSITCTDYRSKGFFSGALFDTVIFPEESNMTTIPLEAFSGCKNLKSVILPSSVIEINAKAFYACSALESITIPTSVTKIAADAFNANASTLLTGVTFNVASGSSAEALLTDMGIPSSQINTYIYSATKDANSMEWSFNIATGAVSVRHLKGASAATATCFEADAWTSFRSANSSAITSIYIEYVEDGYNFTSLRGPIQHMSNLVSVTWDARLFAGSGLYGDANRGWAYCYYNNPKMTTFGPAGTDAGVCDLSNFGEIVCTDYRSKGLFAKTAIEKVIFPENAAFNLIPVQAFDSCPNLTEVVIPSTVTGINSLSFNNCPALVSVTIPESVTAIAANAFLTSSGALNSSVIFTVYEDSSAETLLREIGFTDSQLNIILKNPTGSDSGTEGIEWIMEDGVVTVTPASSNTTGTAKIGAANWISFIGVYKSQIREIVIKNTDAVSIKTLYVCNKALLEYPELSKITIPETVIDINCDSNRYAIANNSKLTTFGPSGTEIGTCDLTSITVNPGSYNRRYMFQGAAFEKVLLPTASSVTSNPDGYFNNCDSLKEVVIPDNFKTLAFIFTNCDALEKVTFLSDSSINLAYASASFGDATLYVFDSSPVHIWAKTATNMSGEPYAIEVMDKIEKGMAFDGFSVRYKGYNGLRSVFTMNKSKANTGFELVEYGAFVIAEKYVDQGESIYLTYKDGEIVPETGKPSKKLSIWKNGETVESYLSDSNGYMQFAVTVVNYSPAQMDLNVYVHAYEAWKDADGNVKIIYTDSTEPMSLLNASVDFLELTVDNESYSSYRTDIVLSAIKTATGDSVISEGAVNSGVSYRLLSHGDACALYYGGSGAVDAAGFDGDHSISTVITDSGITEISADVAEAFVEALWININPDIVGAPEAAVKPNLTICGIDFEGTSIYNAAGVSSELFSSFNDKLSSVFGYTLPFAYYESDERMIVFKVDSSLSENTNKNYTENGKLYISASDADVLSMVILSLADILPDSAEEGSTVNVTLPEVQTVAPSILDDIAEGVATEMKLSVETDKSPVEYAVNETMTFNVSLLSGEEKRSCPLIKYTVSREGEDDFTAYCSGMNGTASIETSMNMAGFAKLTFTACDYDGNKIASLASVSVGAGASVADIEPASEEPADWEEFWAEQIAKLDAVAPEILSIKDGGSTDSYWIYDVQVACIGDESYTGNTYTSLVVTVPKNAAEKSLGIFVQFMGAGVRNAYSYSTKSSNMISIGVNGHSIPNDESAEYYSELANGVLKDYAHPADETVLPENYYHCYMILRDLQALRWAKNYFGAEGTDETFANLWDGENIIVNGISEGGFQSLAVAALDSDVTSVSSAYVPAMADKHGINIGRAKGYGSSYENVLYFDTCYFARRINCTVKIVVGLVDVTCPPSSITAMYNNLASSDKVITYYQYLGHSYPDSSVHVPYRYEGELS